MTFAEKLKGLRKKTGISQEELAEKIGVSRQAVTKWETDSGIPDIDNLKTISAYFNVSIDELLSNDTVAERTDEFLYESVTEYDISEPKHYDMKFGGAKRFVLSGYSGEKIRVRLASDTLPNIQSDFKVKIDDIKRRIDVDLNRKNVTEIEAKGGLFIFVDVPSPYIGKIECSVIAEEVEVRNFECESIELDTKTQSVLLDGVVGKVEINCNLDMSITCKTLQGGVEINQISATSRISLPEDVDFKAVKKGIKNNIYFEKDGKSTQAFDVKDSENYIELNGVKSELIIFKSI